MWLIKDFNFWNHCTNNFFNVPDIVQFVPYRDAYSWMASICPDVASKWSSSYGSTGRLAKIRLAQEVLAEIPEQLTSFMKSKGLIPGSFPHCSSNNNVTHKEQ